MSLHLLSNIISGFMKRDPKYLPKPMILSLIQLLPNMSQSLRFLLSFITSDAGLIQ